MMFRAKAHDKSNHARSSHTARWLTGLLALAILSVGAITLPSTAQADELAQMKQKVQSYTLKLADLEKADADKSAIKELKLTQLWLNEAQAQIAKEEEDAAAKELRRVEVSIEMLEKLVVYGAADARAQEREAAAVQMEREANEAKIKLEQAQARKKQLQTETSQESKP